MATSLNELDAWHKIICFKLCKISSTDAVSVFLFFISRIFQFLCHCDRSEDDIYWNSLMLDVTIKSKGSYEGLRPTSASTCEAFNALMTEPALSRRYNSYAPPPSAVHALYGAELNHQIGGSVSSARDARHYRKRRIWLLDAHRLGLADDQDC